MKESKARSNLKQFYLQNLVLYWGIQSFYAQIFTSSIDESDVRQIDEEQIIPRSFPVQILHPSRNRSPLRSLERKKEGEDLLRVGLRPEFTFPAEVSARIYTSNPGLSPNLHLKPRSQPEFTWQYQLSAGICTLAQFLNP